jgi:predicted adenine nucleotide alpha hydrolase (AANH) superfamily ATPase
MLEAQISMLEASVSHKQSFCGFIFRKKDAPSRFSAQQKDEKRFEIAQSTHKQKNLDKKLTD